MLSRKTLWSVLVGTLAALPALHGLREPPQAAAPKATTEVKAEVAPVPETRRDFEQDHVRDEVDDAPARAAGIVAALPASAPGFADVERAAVGRPAEAPNVTPLARRALGRPRVRAPDATARLS